MLDRPRDMRSMVGIACGLCACGLTITLIYFLVSLYTEESSSSENGSSALIAAIFEALALACIVVSIFVLALSPNTVFQARKKVRWSLISVTTMSFVIAAIVSLVSIIMAVSDSDSNSSLAKQFHSSGIDAAVLYAIWALASLLKIGLLLLCFLPAHARPSHSKSESGGQSFTTASDITKKSTSFEMGVLPPVQPQIIQPATARNSVISTASSQKSTLKASLHQVLHSSTSRTRLLRQRSFQSNMSAVSEPRTSVGSRHADAFDTWEVESQHEHGVLPRHLRLEPIPGSRPASPAKALDGPFLQSELDSPDSLLPEPPLPSPAVHSFHDGGRPFTRERSASSSSQAHIHPLFRTSSPQPPPMASPGTIVTASQWGGQIVTDRQRAMSITSRSSSRPASPGMPTSAWIRPESRSSARSVRVPLRSVRSEDQLVHGVPQKGAFPFPEQFFVRRQQSFCT